MMIKKLLKLFAFISCSVVLVGCSQVESTASTNDVYVESVKDSEEKDDIVEIQKDVIKEVVLPNEEDIMEKVELFQSIDPSETLEVTIFKEIYDQYGVEEGSKYYEQVKDALSDEDKWAMLTYRSFKDEYDIQRGMDVDTLIEQVKQENPLLVEDLSMEDNELKVVVKNQSNSTIGYFKYDIFYYDAAGNIVNSGWSNSSNTILPNAQCVATTFVDVSVPWETLKVVIDEVSYK